MGDVARVDAFAHLHPTLGRTPHELARNLAGLGDTVFEAEHGSLNVVGAEAADPARVDLLDRHAEPALQLGTPEQPLAALVARRHEQVADRIEERSAELAEEWNAGAHQRDLGRGRELLAHAAHGLPRGPRGDLRTVGEDDVAGSEEREVVRNARSDRAGAGYDNSSSHVSSSRRSSSVSCRSGGRTSSRIGTPRRCSTRFSAAWRG